MAAISPSTISTAALFFGVDLQKEQHLMWILREFTCVPLPPNYSQAYNKETKQNGYINNITGIGATEHPAKSYFAGLIAQERENHKTYQMSDSCSVDSSQANESVNDQPKPQPQPQQNWMEFVEPVQNVQNVSEPPLTSPASNFQPFYHDFSKNERVDKNIATMTEILAPDSHPVFSPTKNYNKNNVGRKPATNLLRVPSKFMPRLLKFNSWWQEGNAVNGGLRRRDVVLIFDTLHNTIKLKLDDGDLYHCENSQSLTYWDLHVGAVVQCMGRATTLMVAASLETSKWYDIEFKRLMKIKSTLDNEIKKYSLHRAMQDSEKGVPSKGNKIRGLGWLVTKCEELAGELFQLRPSIKYVEKHLLQ